MGQGVSTLRGILSNVETVCNGLHNLVSVDLVGQGLVIVAKIKEFTAAFPWYYSTAFAVGAFIYFLPEILNMMAEWIRALRSAWQKFKYVYSNVLLSGSSGSTVKSTQLEKGIVTLEVEYKNLEKLLKKNQDYAIKNSTRPFNILMQNKCNQIPLTGQKQETQPIKITMSSTNCNYGSIETRQCKQSYQVPIEFVHR